MKLFNLIIIFSLSYSLIAHSQVSQEWVQRYDGPNSALDLASKMILGDDGSIFVFGNSTGVGSQADMTILKYAAAGNLLWVSRYNGIGNASDYLRSAALDADGNIYAVGYITDSSFAPRMSTLKFDPAGNFLWIRYFDSAGYSNSFGQDIAVSPAGYIYVCGFARNAQGNFDYVTMRYTPSGDKLWTKLFDGMGHGDDNSVGMVCDEMNNVYVTGSSYGLFNSEDIVTVKYNPSGSLLLEWTYDGPSGGSDRPSSITLDEGGHFIITGVTHSDTSNFDFITFRIAPAGSPYWFKKYNGTGNHIDYAYAVVTDDRNNIYVTGSSRNGAALGTEDVLTIKYDSLGNTLWINRFDGQPGGSDIGYCITTDKDYNVYIGSATDRDTNHLIFGTIKLNPSGNQLWLKTYEYAQAPEDFPYDIAVDTSGNVYLCGISFGGVTDYDITTIKYSQSIGISQISGSVPEEFRLHQNYPNPFNPSTKIKFDILQGGLVKLSVYNSLGEQVAVLINQPLLPGAYEYNFDASFLPSGVYFYSLKSNGFQKTNKMTLIR